VYFQIQESRIFMLDIIRTNKKELYNALSY